MDAITPLTTANTVSCNNLAKTDTCAFSLAGAAVSLRQSLNLTLTTAEDDHLTLNSSSEMTAAYAVYKRDGSAVQASLLAQTQASSATLQGDLNKAESLDIAKAIRTYTKIAKHLEDGRTQAAEAHARQFSRLHEITGFEATSVSQQSIAVTMSSTAP